MLVNGYVEFVNISSKLCVAFEYFIIDLQTDKSLLVKSMKEQVQAVNVRLVSI